MEEFSVMKADSVEGFQLELMSRRIQAKGKRNDATPQPYTFYKDFPL